MPFASEFAEACAPSHTPEQLRLGRVDSDALDIAGLAFTKYRNILTPAEVQAAVKQFNAAHSAKPSVDTVGVIYRGPENTWEVVLTTKGLLCFVPGRPPAVPAVELTEPRRRVKRQVQSALDLDPNAILPTDPVKLMDRLSTIFHSHSKNRIQVMQRIINGWNITCGGPDAPKVDITAVSDNDWILAYHQGRFQLTERPKGDPK